MTIPRPSTPGSSRTQHGRLGRLVRRPVVGVGAVALVLVAGAAAAGTDTFRVFRTDGVAPVEVRVDDLVSLPDLSGLGDVEVTHEPAIRTVDDAAAASEETGLSVPTLPDLPAGLGDEPTYQVAEGVEATVTLDAATAADAGLPTMPDGLDGTQVQVAAGPGLAQLWVGEQNGMPRLVVATGLAPVVTSADPDVDLDEVRDYVLSVPGFPDDVAAQLDDLDAGDGTLPLPVPSGLVDTTTADLGGVSASVFETSDRAVGAVVWVEEGVVTVVAGAYSGDELVDLARSLR